MGLTKPVARGWFWIPAGVLAWVYAGYPAAAAVRARIRPFRVQPGGAAPRMVTVGIVARDEAARIGDRIRNILEQDLSQPMEVIVVSDGSTDGTAAIAQRSAAGDPRIRVLDLPHAGQASGQNAIFREARGEVVVLTDAETRFAPGCLAALVAPFDDPAVGCTTGRLEWWWDDREAAAARHEGLYWRYELLVRAVESRAGWLTAVTGAVLAVRRSGYRPVPDHASLDQLLPLHVRDQGLTVLAVHDARAFDRGWTGRDDQFLSRARIATQGIAANLSMATRLTPWRRPGASLAIWSHKILRWATPWLWSGSVVGAARLATTGRRGYVLPVGASVAVLLVAAAGMVAERLGRPIRAASFPVTIVNVNLAFAVAWLNVIRGRTITGWRHPDSG